MGFGADSQHHRTPPFANFFRLESDQTCYRYIFHLCLLPEIRSRGGLLGDRHRFSPGFFRAARTLLSRYSSR
jgi:hypothetical protein